MGDLAGAQDRAACRDRHGGGLFQGVSARPPGGSEAALPGCRRGVASGVTFGWDPTRQDGVASVGDASRFHTLLTARMATIETTSSRAETTRTTRIPTMSASGAAMARPIG